VLVVFAGLCALAIVFVWKFLPETKGLPVEEIVRVFERQQEKSVLPGGSEQAT
jgi:H+/Cl- antiporter ClcA